MIQGPPWPLAGASLPALWTGNHVRLWSRRLQVFHARSNFVRASRYTNKRTPTHILLMVTMVYLQVGICASRQK